MWLAVLGPLQVHDGEAPVAVPRGRLRVLLAALLLHAGSPVGTDALSELVWDGAPPASASVTLRSTVLRLRRVLGPRAGARLVTRHPGYLLQAGEDEIDVLRFRGLCRDGGAALREGDWARADGLLGEALGLWRGAPLADVPSELLLRQEAPSLEELRLQAEERRADAALHLGRHDELVAGLQSLSTRHPLRERFHAQLILALYRCGRQAEALAAYQHARRALIDKAGAEPGPELRQLNQQVLAADPALAAPESPGGAGRSVIPQELPPAPRHFTGRTRELAALTGLLGRPQQQPQETVVITAIGGTAGVGKTALAVHWAYQAAGRFPDGQLYVNLRGYDPDQPMPATDVLAGFLRSLGVPGQDIPPEAEQRAARYRSLLAGKQMLVVLDNAGTSDQVRPLLPGAPACAVVVTSRDALAGLVARDGAVRLDLDLLPVAEAVALLRALIGARVDAEPVAAAELAGQCCRLPLALRVAAELAASRPDVPLAGLAAELADLSTRLDLLKAGEDPHTQVRAVFSWSYRNLDAETARTFRLIGLHPGPDIEAYAAAALTGATVAAVRRMLDTLTRAHLVQPVAAARYGMHDLLRGYARELAATLDAEEHKRAALTRLFDHYLHTAAVAMDTLFPAEREHRPRISHAVTPVRVLADAVSAREWLDSERPTLVAATGHAAANGWPGHATRLAATVATYLYSGGHFAEVLAVFSHALDAARRAGDHVAEATALTEIGNIDLQQCRLPEAVARHQEALVLFRESGDRTGEAHALDHIGFAEMHQGRYEQATRHHQEAVAICRDIGDRFGEARALGHLGVALRMQGRYQEAASCYRQSLELSREIGDRHGEAWALARLGIVDLWLGRYQGAARYLEHALTLFRSMGHVGSEAECQVRLGDICVRLGRYEQAAWNFEQALAVFREIGDPDLETEALNGLGDVLYHTGDAGKARVHHARALHLASQADMPRAQARAHSGLARVCQADGDPVQARHHWREALTRYEAIGAPEASEIRDRLALAGEDVTG